MLDRLFASEQDAATIALLRAGVRGQSAGTDRADGASYVANVIHEVEEPVMSRVRQFQIPAWVAALGALLVVLAAWGIWSATDSASAAAPSNEQRLLTFTGSGSAQIAPDSASISAGVSATGRDADSAQDAASRKMRALVAHMKSQGLDAADLQTTDATVSEDWERKGRFVANQSLSIRVEDPARAGALLGEATQGGADTVSGPAFGLEDQRAGYDEALRAAIADARAKADAAASHMDAEVRAVYSIGESANGSVVPMFGATTEARAMDAATPVPTEQGTQTVAITVQVSFTYER